MSEREEPVELIAAHSVQTETPMVFTTPAKAAESLRRLAISADAAGGGVGMSPRAARAIADMLAPPNGDSPVTRHEVEHLRTLLFDQGQQMIACGAALRLLRVYQLGPVEFEESRAIVDYLRGWIDDGRWLGLAWPEQLPGVCRWLIDVGFAPVDGRIGLPERHAGGPVFSSSKGKNHGR